jgi:CubicO group peptidase (beta-lactamase class C family)
MPTTTIDGYVHPGFADVADRLRRMYRRPGSGGGALAVRLRGETVVDVWAGSVDPAGDQPWERDTMAMSFSTTKGVAATVVHRLADRGLLDYDERVAAYWPQFGAAGKHDVTVRQLLSHQAGLHNVRDLVVSTEELLDHVDVEQRLARTAPDPAPGTGPGYHGFTFGWLVAGLARAITGHGMRRLVEDEIVAPLGLDGMAVGVDVGDEAARGRVAPLLFNSLEPVRVLATRGNVLGWTQRLAEAFYIERFGDLLADPTQRILDSEMPAVNGCFTARSLATMYAALANGGTVDGVELLSRLTVHEAGRVVTRRRDYVLGIPMRWRLGYHQAFTAGRSSRRAFGHYGFGGSGAWADPSTGLSVGFVTNRLGSGTTPIADIRLMRLNAMIVSSAWRMG